MGKISGKRSLSGAGNVAMEFRKSAVVFVSVCKKGKIIVTPEVLTASIYNQLRVVKAVQTVIVKRRGHRTAPLV